MKKKKIILVSPAPLDGYPPVQNQVKLLAEEGYCVTVITSRLYNHKDLSFSHRGVEVSVYSLSGPNYSFRQLNKIRFLFRLLWLRFSLRPVCEISYDPEGLFFSKICPFKPRVIIGHLHEVLIDPEKRFFERFAIPFFQKLSLVVVADCDRAELLAGQVSLPCFPIVVRNVPFLEDELVHEVKDTNEPFSVVYHGAIGLTQALDNIIRSMKFWPSDVCFYLYGVPREEIKVKLLEIAKNIGVIGRVSFQGWVPYAQMAGKLSRHNLGVSILRPSHENNRLAAGASNKRYQYMQVSLPQIADDTPSARELIEGNAVGLCVSPESPEAIAQAVNYFYENPAICAEYGNRARKLVEEKYRYDLEFKPVIDFIKSSHN